MLEHLSGFAVVRLCLGCILLLAAILKLHQPGTALASLGLSFSESASYWLLLCVIEFEVLLGVWLIFGIAQRASWRCAIAIFLVMACITFVKAVRGEESCGCFGAVPVSPWYMFGLDVAATIALCKWRPLWEANADGETPRRVVARPRIALLTVVAGLTIYVCAVGAKFAPGRISADGRMPVNRIVLLEPDQWNGQRLPVVEFIDGGKQFESGQWFIVFYHDGCPNCADVISDCESLVRQANGHVDSPRFAMVEVPPYGSGKVFGKIPHPLFFITRLDESHDWFVQTPAVVSVVDGIVTAVGRDVETTVRATNLVTKESRKSER